jgi:hypothetical protein
MKFLYLSDMIDQAEIKKKLGNKFSKQNFPMMLCERGWKGLGKFISFLIALVERK